MSPLDPAVRVRLLRCSVPHIRLQPGAWGTATRRDDAGTLHVKWDNGSSLGLIAGTDEWEEHPLDTDTPTDPDGRASRYNVPSIDQLAEAVTLLNAAIDPRSSGEPVLGFCAHHGNDGVLRVGIDVLAAPEEIYASSVTRWHFLHPDGRTEQVRTGYEPANSAAAARISVELDIGFFARVYYAISDDGSPDDEHACLIDLLDALHDTNARERRPAIGERVDPKPVHLSTLTPGAVYKTSPDDDYELEVISVGPEKAYVRRWGSSDPIGSSVNLNSPNGTTVYRVRHSPSS